LADQPRGSGAVFGTNPCDFSPSGLNTWDERSNV